MRLLICLMIMCVSQAVKVGDVFSVEQDIVIASAENLFSFRTALPRIVREFLAKPNLFFDLRTARNGISSHGYFTFSNNQISNGTDTFTLTNDQMYQLVDLMRMAATGIIISEDEYYNPIILRENDKTCLIDVRREADEYNFVVYVFGIKSISPDLTRKLNEASTDTAKQYALIQSLKYVNPYDAYAGQFEKDNQYDGCVRANIISANVIEPTVSVQCDPFSWWNSGNNQTRGISDERDFISLRLEACFRIMANLASKPVSGIFDRGNYTMRITICFDGEKFHMIPTRVAKSNNRGFLDDVRFRQGIVEMLQRLYGTEDVPGWIEESILDLRNRYAIKTMLEAANRAGNQLGERKLPYLPTPARNRAPTPTT